MKVICQKAAEGRCSFIVVCVHREPHEHNHRCDYDGEHCPSCVYIGESKLLSQLIDEHSTWTTGFFKRTYEEAFEHGYKHGLEDGKNV